LIGEEQRLYAVDDEIDEDVDEEEVINVAAEEGRLKQSNLDTFMLKPPSISSDKSEEGSNAFLVMSVSLHVATLRQKKIGR